MRSIGFWLYFGGRADIIGWQIGCGVHGKGRQVKKGYRVSVGTTVVPFTEVGNAGVHWGQGEAGV